MRHISFSLTTAQVKARTKTVTRRLNWLKLKTGDRLQGCVKCMGLKRGEKPQKLAVIEVVRIYREPLNYITAADCEREGFPGMTPMEFVEMFCKHMKTRSDTIITRIEFKYVDL